MSDSGVVRCHTHGSNRKKTGLLSIHGGRGERHAIRTQRNCAAPCSAPAYRWPIRTVRGSPCRMALRDSAPAKQDGKLRQPFSNASWSGRSSMRRPLQNRSCQEATPSAADRQASYACASRAFGTGWSYKSRSAGNFGCGCSGKQRRVVGNVGRPVNPVPAEYRAKHRGCSTGRDCGQEKVLTRLAAPPRPVMRTPPQPGYPFAPTPASSRPLLSKVTTSLASAWPVSLIAASQAATPAAMASMTRGNGVPGDQS